MSMPEFIKTLANTSFFRFCIVGTLGFVTDAVVLSLVLRLSDWGPVTARIPAFIVAVLVTWYFNRGFTFKAHDTAFIKSFPTYLASNSIGLAINFGCYTGGVMAFDILGAYPVLALAIGSIVALFFNFAAAKLFIFKKTAAPGKS